MNIAHLIRTFRLEKGLSQEQCAELLSVEPTTVSRWERGVVVPNAATQARIIATIKPRTGFDAQIKQIISTSPALMQLLLPHGNSGRLARLPAVRANPGVRDRRAA